MCVTGAAQIAQKDPKEYIPLLTELEALPEPLRRHRIDMRLGRFVSALRSLADAGPSHFDACLELIRAQRCVVPTD